MSRTPVIVIIDSIDIDISAQLTKKLAPYDYNRYETETKQYIVDVAAIPSVCSHHQADSSEELLLILKRKSPEDEFGLDDIGIWQKTDYNLSGEWDFWVIGGLFSSLFA